MLKVSQEEKEIFKQLKQEFPEVSRMVLMAVMTDCLRNEQGALIGFAQESQQLLSEGVQGLKTIADASCLFRLTLCRTTLADPKMLALYQKTYQPDADSQEVPSVAPTVVMRSPGLVGSGPR